MTRSPSAGTASTSCPPSASRQPGRDRRPQGRRPGLEPVITTGIAHREPGIGQIGAGLTHAPMACFTAALDALAPPLADAA